MLFKFPSPLDFDIFTPTHAQNQPIACSNHSPFEDFLSVPFTPIPKDEIKKCFQSISGKVVQMQSSGERHAVVQESV
jgi:hypothetical protein